MSRLAGFLFLVLLLTACAPASESSTGEVAIYLPTQPMSGRDILAANLGTLQLQPQPIVSSSELVSYGAASHDFTFAPAAVKRISELKVPVQGLGFVICVDRQPVVAGAFWVLWSSLSFEGPTLNLPLEPDQAALHFYGGYPELDKVVPNDPRTDPRLLDALRKAGKLR